jgi:HNH endonuclease/RuvA, C-terminal domain
LGHAVSAPVPAQPPSPLPIESSATPLLRPGHWRSLELLENTQAALDTLARYEQALGHPVYLRLTPRKGAGSFARCARRRMFTSAMRASRNISSAFSASDARVGADVAIESRANSDAHVGAKEDPPGAVVSALSQELPQTRDAGHSGQPRTRAKQTIPPAVRRSVLTRDQRRCRVPGCTHATFVDVHHIVPRSEGGRNEPTNLVTLCGSHHRAVHRGELMIEPGGETGIRFRHADGTLYGLPATPHAVDVQTKIFSALRNLGFREREIRAVLAELQREEHCEPTAPGLLREALRRIRQAPR